MLYWERPSLIFTGCFSWWLCKKFPTSSTESIYYCSTWSSILWEPSTTSTLCEYQVGHDVSKHDVFDGYVIDGYAVCVRASSDGRLHRHHALSTQGVLTVQKQVLRGSWIPGRDRLFYKTCRLLTNPGDLKKHGLLLSNHCLLIDNGRALKLFPVLK